MSALVEGLRWLWTFVSRGTVPSFQVSPQQNAYRNPPRREQSLSGAFGLEVPFEDEDISATVEAEAINKLKAAVELYTLSPLNVKHISSNGPNLHAGKLLMALVDNAPGSGRYEVLKATLRYLYNIPFKSEADGTLTMPRLDSILEAVRGCSVEGSVVNERIYCFAEHIINSLFIPILAEGGKTEAPPTKLVTPHGSAVPVGSVHGRLASFRDSLSDREGARCAITGHIHMEIVQRLLQENPDLDRDSIGGASHCEGAHIIPHGRNEAGVGGALSESKKYFWTLLRMFAPQLGMLVLAENIDKPHNGLFLTHDRHKDFSALKIWLEETETADTYILRMSSKHYLPPGLGMEKVDKPITFKNHAEKNIDLPDKYLLKIHASLARILEASGAAEYVEHLLRETDKITALSDGVTDLTAFFASRGLVEVR